MLSSLSFSREIVLVSSKTSQTGRALSAVQGQPWGFRDSGQLLDFPHSGGGWVSEGLSSLLEHLSHLGLLILVSGR